MGAALDEDERGQDDEPEDDQPAHGRVGPLAALLVREPDEDRDERAGQERGARVVERTVRDILRMERQGPPDHDEDDRSKRQVDEEDPVPADRVGDDPADGRPDDRAEAEHRPEEALVLAPLRRREDVADDRERHREQRARAKALDPAEEDELPHLLRQPAQRRADEEDRDTDQEDGPPPIEVGQLAVDRAADRRGQQVRGECPDVDVVAVEVGHDDRQRGPDDRLVQGGEQDAQENREQDLHPHAVREFDRGAVLGWWVHGGHDRTILVGQVGRSQPVRRRAASAVVIPLSFVRRRISTGIIGPCRNRNVCTT